MRSRNLIPVLLAAVCSFASSSRAENIPDLFLHQGQSLSGDWQTIVDPYESGFYDYRWTQRDKSDNPSRAEAFYLDAHPTDSSERIEYDFDKSPSLKVPGDWNTQKPELFYYEGSLWYRRKFDFNGIDDGGRCFLRFGAANYRADVYLNGKKLGQHTGGFTPFTFDATKLLKKGGNSLVVRVDNKRFKDAVPTLNTDWWNYGGLTRDVTLVRTPEKYIADHRIILESEETKMISGSVEIAGAGEGEAVEISIAGLGSKHEVKTDAKGKATFSFAAPDVQLWSPETPKLYDLTVSYGVDKVSEPVGFRTIRTHGRELLLNGKPVFLRGICIHEEFALNGGGRVNTPEKAEQLLKWAKELNCNFVRLAHYPHNETMTRLADKMGILVWSEVPVYWTIDWSNPETYQNAERQVSDMIRRDANRASIIIWSLANETPVSDARTTFLSNLAKKARELDGTRLLSAAMEVRNKPGSPNVSLVEDPLSNVLDIVSFNQYNGWYSGLPEKCARVTWEIPYEKPVFISEFGGDARQGLHGGKLDRWTEEYQEDLYRQTFPMLEKINGLAGFSPWILMDFRSPKRALPGVQDGFNRKGLISSEGVKKKAFVVLQDYYRHKAEQAAGSK
ncbi:MAG: glycoside hydrolase family 2 TIM barrel-domain containing protein [Luteolibacter sp.]